MLKKLLTITLSLVLSSPIFSQNSPIISSQVRSLAQQITSGKSTDSLKVRAIYEWVAKNIDYDVPLLQKMNKKSIEEFIQLQQSSAVLSSKKAVCMGYSILFKELCEASNITAEFLAGYSKGLDPETGKLKLSDVLHAWNAVKVNKNWYLVDLTWSAGQVDEKQGRFVKAFNEKYYLSDNKKFVNDHLPFDPIWQLSNQPLSVREFRLYQGFPPSRTNPPTISFMDTLQVYEKQDYETKRLNSYRRALIFDRGNDEAKAALGYHYSNLALKSLEDFNKIIKSSVNVHTPEAEKMAIAKKEEMYNLLKGAEKNLRLARYNYIQIPANSKFADVAQGNKEATEQNQGFIAQSRTFLADYFKNVGK